MKLEDLGSLSQYANGSSKRRKTRASEYDEDKFKPGYIIKVVVQNFTTYSYAEFNLSPTLNMIIGPNGTGKSTLVAAICLGLGGKLEYIKRKTMKSMIKSGQEKGTIEITMRDKEGKPPLHIKRTFTESESNWWMNNSSSNEKQVRAKCASLNIQLDNLCHFLPQERVAEFAGLSPEKLLLETERTLGDGHLLGLHQSLISLDSESNDLGSRIKEIETRLEKLESEKGELEAEAQKVQEYEEVSERLNKHLKLVPFAQLADLQRQVAHLKVQRDQAKADLSLAKQKYKPVTDAQDLVVSELNEKLNEHKELKSKRTEVRSRFDMAQLDCKKISDKIDVLSIEVKTLANKSAEKKSQLEKLRADQEELFRKRKSIPEVDNNELKSLNEEKFSIRESVDTMNSKLEDLQGRLTLPRNIIRQCMSEISQYESRLSSKDKLDILEPNPNQRYQNNVRDGAYEAHKLLRRQSEFKGLYSEAPVVCCDVTDKSYAHYLEKVIDNNTLFAITVSSSETYRSIADFAFKKVNFPVRVTNVREKPAPVVPINELRSYGFDGYLGDFLTGPDEVLCMLYDTAKIHTLPVSKRPLSEQNMKKLTSKIVFRKFIAGDTLFSVQQSNYGNKQVFYRTERIDPKAFYFGSSGLTLEAKEALNEKISQSKQKEQKAKEELQAIQEEVRLAETEKKSIIDKSNQLGTRIEELNRLKKSRAALDGNINSKEESIKTLDRESRKDYTDKIKSVKLRIQEAYKTRATEMARLAEYTSELSQCEIVLNLKELEVLQVQNKQKSLRWVLDEVEDLVKSLMKTYEELKKKFSAIKHGPAADEIRELRDKLTPEDRVQLSDLIARYQENNELTEQIIREKIQNLENEKKLRSTADQSSIETLKNKREEIARYGTQLPKIKERKLNLEKQIATTRQEWEPELTKFVSKISLAFNERFTKVASDGRVELAMSERFSDWKLQILVKFRQESELKVLDHQSQSGGERAVSTIFFIMSLQGLTDAPLRVVDEINQGMDPKNEKMAHRYLVHTACQNNSSQYFLVTPKLLTGLYYHPDMVVHCIYTGPLIEQTRKSSNAPGFLDFINSRIKA